MKRKRQILTAVILSGSVGLGTQSILAQSGPGGSAPGGPSGPSVPGQTGPTSPQPDPSSPRQTQPTIPGQTAPSSPGQTDRMPGQPGTIPERVERPSAGTQQGLASSDDIKKAKEALKAKGHNPGDMDGNMDAKTQQALRDFQKANQLPVTGTLDQQTAEKLGVNLSGAKGSGSQRSPDSSMPRGGSSAPGGSLGPGGDSSAPSGKGSTR
jgi:peptidoglycan hydrolase-like protein with peptidoglycan-binding domain